jgi:hypothetical protein
MAAKKKKRVRVSVYVVIQRAVEEGIAFGLNRAYKHTDSPSRDTLVENIEREVMNSLYEVIKL